MSLTGPWRRLVRGDHWLLVDPRGICVWRRLLGCLVLLDLLGRWPDLEAHYTDQGVLPRALFVDHRGAAAPWLQNFRISGQYLWSMLFLDGSKEWASGVFAAAAMGAVLLVSGRVPRFASFVVWFFLTSIQARNSLINSGGDTLLRVMLFWSVLLPCSRNSAGWKSRGAWVASLGLVCQIAVVYAVTAWLKVGEAWLYGGHAIRDALQIEAFARPSAAWLLDRPEILPFVTRCTWGFEAAIPLFVLISPAWPAARTVAFCLIVGLHLGIASFLNIGLFQPIAIVSALPLLPSSWWDGWEAAGPCQRLFFPSLSAGGVAEEGGARSRTARFAVPGFLLLRRAMALLSLMMSATALMLVMTRQVDAIVPRQRLIPQPLMVAGEILRLDQYWGMFAPYPSRSEQGDFSHEGESPHDPGITFDADGKATEPLSGAFRSDRWRKLYLNLSHDQFKAIRPGLGRYLYRGNRVGRVIFTGRDGRVVVVTGG